MALDVAATAAARTIAMQMLQERGRGAVLVGVARVDAALEHLLQALMGPAPNRGDGLFLPDRPLGSLGAKVAEHDGPWRNAGRAAARTLTASRSARLVIPSKITVIRLGFRRL
jgi:hypothetical protein